MAYFDKTYVDSEQWYLAKNFWEETKEQQRSELGGLIGLYYDEPQGSEFVLWNTSIYQDIWLRKNCRLDFIQDRLNFQYGNSSNLDILANLCDFSHSGIYLQRIESSDNIYIDFTFQKDGENYILDESNEICVYGTTLFFKILNGCIESLKSYGDKFDGEIDFSYFGANFTYRNGKLYYDDENYVDRLGYFSDDLIKLPKIKYSLNSKDITKYPKEFVFLSTEDEIYPLDSYKEIEKFSNTGLQKALKFGRFGIPEYVRRLIK